jgi:mRNA-degrading endonuclease RelE of RelBE toxin-antitoxin system
MAFRIIFHPIADKEFSAAYRWYEERLEGLGERFSKAIDEQLSQIAKSPLQYPVKKNSFRAAKASTFPYVIIYKVYKKEKLILISAVYHTSRNPRKKFRK